MDRVYFASWRAVARRSGGAEVEYGNWVGIEHPLVSKVFEKRIIVWYRELTEAEVTLLQEKRPEVLDFSKSPNKIRIVVPGILSTEEPG